MAATQTQMHSAQALQYVKPFIHVEDLALVLGKSVPTARRHFQAVKRLASVRTHNIEIDLFILHAVHIAALKGIKKESFIMHELLWMKH